MHQALYRKYRPAVFEDVCGQSHITDVLRYESAAGKLSHAYLFCGSRGTGKTSCAKILARAVNCEAPINGSPCCRCAACLDIESGRTTDVVEMDAASNNGVDAIRELCEEVVYTPAMLKKKVYIIDEVHMLSQGAWGALLKTIEEPPEHVIFILATTELHKVPATIISRCQRFDFRRIDVRVIADRLKYIAGREEMTLEDDAALLIARQAQGGMRDAVGLLELCAAGGADITAERVRDVTGLSGIDAAASVFSSIKENRADMLFSLVSQIYSSSRDISVFWQELISFVRDMLVFRYSGDAAGYLDLTAPEAAVLSDAAGKFNLSELIFFCRVLDDAAAAMLRSPQNKRLTAELSLLKMCRPELDGSTEALSARISALEDKLTLGGFDRQSPQEKVNPAKAKAEKEDAQPAGQPKPEAPVTAQAAEEYIPVRDISEAVGKLSGANRVLAQFIMSAAAEVSPDGTRLRLTADGFAAEMLAKKESRDAVAEAFALAKITSGIAEVIIEKKKNRSTAASPSDDLGELL